MAVREKMINWVITKGKRGNNIEIIYPLQILDDCIRWCSEQMEQFNQQKEDLVFLRGFVSAFKAQIHTDILVSPGRHGPPIPAHKSVLVSCFLFCQLKLRLDHHSPLSKVLSELKIQRASLFKNKLNTWKYVRNGYPNMHKIFPLKEKEVFSWYSWKL